MADGDNKGTVSTAPWWKRSVRRDHREQDRTTRGSSVLFRYTHWERTQQWTLEDSGRELKGIGFTVWE